MKQKFRSIAAIGYAMAAMLISVGFTSLPAFLNHAGAAQVTARSIEMSSAASGASSTTYRVSFTPGTTLASGGPHDIVVDICDNDPLIGDGSCTYPTGFNWGGATPSLSVVSGMGASGGDWAASGHVGGSGGAQTQTLELQSTTTGSLTATTPAIFDITSVTNPSTANHTFYARILTFDTVAHAGTEYFGGSYSGTTRNTTFADMKDYGGVAMSTSSTIQVTANVMEQITYCVSGPSGGTNPITASCAGAVSPAFTLGHGTPTAVLSNTLIDTSPVYSLLSTNASAGAVVRMKAGNTCTNLAANFHGGLSSNGGTTCAIEAVDSHVGPAGVAITAGSVAGNPGGAFGVCVKAATVNTVAVAPYDAPTGTACDNATNLSDNSGNGFGSLTTKFGMDDTVTSTFGSTLLNTAGAPVNAETDTYVFGGTAANTTPAGIYTGSESLIATGTF